MVSNTEFRYTLPFGLLWAASLKLDGTTERPTEQQLAVSTVIALIQYNNNNNNNNQDNVYGAVIMAEPLREFTRFI